LHFVRSIFHLFYTHLASLYEPVLKLALRGRWIHWQLSLKEYLPDKRRILEIGCGTGSLLAELGKCDLKIMGIDQSHKMIRIAARNIKDIQKPLALIVAQAQALPFKNGSLDTILSMFPSEYIRCRKTWREIKRLLAPEGIFVCLIWVKMRPGTLHSVVQRIIYGTNHAELESLLHLAARESLNARIEKMADREGNVMFVLLSK